MNLIIIPINCFALTDFYVDIVSKYVDVDVDDKKVNLYLFYGQECPHCEEERRWLIASSYFSRLKAAIPSLPVVFAIFISI